MKLHSISSSAEAWLSARIDSLHAKMVAATTRKERRRYHNEMMRNTNRRSPRLKKKMRAKLEGKL